MAVCERGRLCPLLKVTGAEKFLISEGLLLQRLKYIFNFSFGSVHTKQKHRSVERYPRGEEKKYYSFWETWSQVYRGKKTLKFWLLNSKRPEWSQLRA